MRLREGDPQGVLDDGAEAHALMPEQTGGEFGVEDLRRLEAPSRSDGRSWLAAWRIQVMPPIASCSGDRSPTAGGSMRKTPASRRYTWMRYARCE
jgi:hypothetical protein